MSLPPIPDVTRIRLVVILYRTHACLDHDAMAGMIPTTVKIEMVGMIVSVIAGGPS
jgi:hypothetical protein